MNVLQIIIEHNTTLSGVVMLTLALWIYNQRRKDPKHIALGTLLFTVSLWTFSLALWGAAVTLRETSFWLRTMFFIGSLIPLLFLIFVYVYRFGKMPKRWVQLCAILPNAALFVMTFFTSSVVAPVKGTYFTFGPGRTIYAIHMALFLAISLALLYYRSGKTEKKERRKLILLLIGAIVSFNSIYGILYGTSFTRAPSSLFIANIGLVVGMFFMASALLDQTFLEEIRLIGPQIFIGLTLFVIIFNIVITEEAIDLPLRFVMLAILTSYAGLTTRALLQEMRRIRDVEVMGEQAVEMNRELIEADKMKTRFVSLASHQLRSPIVAVRSYLEMFGDGEFGTVNEEQKKVLATNVSALTTLGDTIETFLDAAKIQLGRLELFLGDTSIKEVITNVTDEFKPLIKQKNLSMEVKVPEDLPTIICDRGKVFHAVANLVDNAIKYTPSGTIVVSVEMKDENVIVRVKDNGIGLDDDHRAHVFNVFQRGMEAVRLDTGGSGLGLYIVKNLVDAHGGRVFAESEGLGKGSTFGFTLPVAGPRRTKHDEKKD